VLMARKDTESRFEKVKRGRPNPHSLQRQQTLRRPINNLEKRRVVLTFKSLFLLKRAPGSHMEKRGFFLTFLWGETRALLGNPSYL